MTCGGLRGTCALITRLWTEDEMADSEAPGPVNDHPVWMSCRVQQLDGSKGCGGTQAVVAADIKIAPQVGLAGQGAGQLLESMMEGRLVRYKCLLCSGIFAVRQ